MKISLSFRFVELFVVCCRLNFNLVVRVVNKSGKTLACSLSGYRYSGKKKKKKKLAAWGGKTKVLEEEEKQLFPFAKGGKNHL